MSLIPVGLSLLQIGISNLIPAIFFRVRIIGTFVANITIEENHLDELAITEHPVEQGAAVTDHSYKRPASLIVRCAWSNSALQALGNPNYVNQVYDAFLSLQATRIPFEVLTGKRKYTNMLIKRLSTVTTEQTENALFLTVELQEILIVSTQTVTVPNADVMKNPQANAPTVQTGVKNVAPAPNFNAGATP